jgi:hypothetical protein
MHMLGKDGILMSSQKVNGEDKRVKVGDIIRVGNKEVPVITAKSRTIITNSKTGVIYKDEAEWKALGIDPKDIKVDVKIQIPSLDLLAKTK